MTPLDQVVAELAREPHLWWGYHAEHGWFVMDRQDVRNSGELRRVLRCSNWSAFHVSRQEFGSSRFVRFQSRLAALPLEQARRESERLLAFRRELTDRTAGLSLEHFHRQMHGMARSECGQLAAIIDGGWRTCEDPGTMLLCLGWGVTLRKIRLFGVACCRRIWGLMPDKDCHAAVELAERIAEGEEAPEAASQLFRRIWDKAEAAVFLRDKVRPNCFNAARCLLQHSGNATDHWARRQETRGYWLWDVYEYAGDARLNAEGNNPDGADKVERRSQAGLLREVLGDPFQPVRLEPSWRTKTVLSIASDTYVQQTFDALPILADALEDAGCDNGDVLAHLRSPGPHVRGCWPLDLLLGKS